ncbi:regulatory protein [Gammaproteobacteria bacterium]|nr:regulatory protein [Gammaproteobacteria bacterium]
MNVMTGNKRWAVPLALLLCVILAFFDKISIAALFSDDQFLADLGIAGHREKLGLLMTAFLLAYGFSSTFLSFIGDLISPFKLLMGMMISWGIIMFFMGRATSYEEMLFYRVLLGIAEGPLFAIAYTIVKKLFEQKEQARATMLWLLGTPIGAAIGFPITLYVLGHYGWRATFYVMASITIIVVLIAYFVLKNIDLAKSQAHANVIPKLQFTDHVKASHVLIKDLSFWLVCIFNIAFLTYLWGFNSWLPSYLKAKGIAQGSLGFFTSLVFVGMLVGEVFGSIVSDKINKRALMCMISLIGAGLGLIIAINVDSHYALIAAVSFSATFWGIGAPNVFALLAKVTDARVSATAGGIFNGLGNFSSSLAPWIIALLVTATNNMNVGILFLAIMSFLGSFVLIPHVLKKI